MRSLTSQHHFRVRLSSKATELFVTLIFLISVLWFNQLVYAGDQPVCEYDEASGRITITASGQWGGILRRNASSIIFKRGHTAKFQNYDGATVDNTERVVWEDQSIEGGASLWIDQSGGPFAPGRTDEKGLSEIEFAVDMEGGTNPVDGPWDLSVSGTDTSDTIIGGTRGLKLNGDGDLDVKARGHVDGYSISAGDGDDSVFMDGRSGTGHFSLKNAPSTLVTGERGSDRLVGGPGDDSLLGRVGKDWLVGRRGRDALEGSLGSDELIGGLDKDYRILGGGGRDLIEGGPGNEYHLEGGDGSDVIKAGSDRDRVYGQAGDDRLLGQGSMDSLFGGEGDDHVIAGKGRDEVRGEPGDDHLEGSAGNDLIFGHEGDDHLDGDAGNDSCNPGTGHNTKEDCES